MVELMIVVAIMGILAAIGVPAVNEWIANQRVRDAAAALQTSLMRARSEALAKGVTVQVVPVGGNWANGWSIPHPLAAYAGTFLEQQGALDGAVVSIGGASTGLAPIAFSPVGRLQGAAFEVAIRVQGTTTARCITVDTAGRAKTRNGKVNASDTVVCP